jgi:DNA-directed RNA polymerase subunit RPC12/RpoP
MHPLPGVHVSLGAKGCEKIWLSSKPQEGAMKESKEEKRARLLAKAAQEIDAYLEWEEENPQPDLTQIEEIALKLRKEFGQAIAQVAIENQASRTPAPGPKCAQCGNEMRSKGQKRTQVESRTGTLEVERGYYSCPKCKERIFPPGSTTQVE